MKITTMPAASAEAPNESEMVPSPATPAKQPWVRPVLTIQPIAANTHHAANTVSDGTGNLFS